MRSFLSLCFFSALSLSTVSSANENFLPPDQAFQFSAESLSKTDAQLKWSIAPHYYLYHDQFKVTVNGQALHLNVPAGQEKDDPTFGKTQVHYQQVTAQIKVQPDSNYQVMYQGCSADGLCYPLQRKTIHSDVDGLFPLGNVKRSLFSQQSKTDNPPENNTPTAPLPEKKSQPLLTEKVKPNPVKTPASDLVENKAVSEVVAVDVASQVVEASVPVSAINESPVITPSTKPSDKPTTSLQLNDDLSFLKLLSKDSIWMNLIIFFGLGILLAFLPCSLPLIPILSGIIVQRATGYKTILIALSFVISMALVYSLMGIVVAEIGYSFQRWFQSPVVLSIFALIFVALALNLFGLYQLNLPQGVMQKLGQLQNKQQGGTILGAGVMGALSALIVGPCMSAPLAGALLFVSQLQSAFYGGLYLFILGLGIGLPLFIASVFGSRFLPKPGVWMDRVKICFGFMMLMVAVYFIRPMLSSMLYTGLLAVLCLILAVYLLLSLRHIQKWTQKIIVLLLATGSLITAGWNIRESVQASQAVQSQTAYAQWHTVRTATELQQALAEAQLQQRPIIIDTYADWCVACQPIEKEVFPRADVQQQLQQFTLIKLDLTHYDASQDIILKQHEILGPPTLLLLNNNAEEYRNLRLTGTFSANQLLQRLNQVAP